MQVDRIKTNLEYPRTTVFKSVYPVYHWCKIDGKYKPISDKDTVGNCQRLLAGMLSKGYKVNPQKENKSFLSRVIKYITWFDDDYKCGHYVRSYYYDDGGIQYDSTGAPCGIEPCAYLLTGVDAAYFEDTYGKPIRLMTQQKDCSEKEIKKTLNRARTAYITQGLTYVKEKCKKFTDKESNVPLELHAIYTQNPIDKKLWISKIEFFKTGAKENPLYRNNII